MIFLCYVREGRLAGPVTNARRLLKEEGGVGRASPEREEIESPLRAHPHGPDPESP